MTRLKEAAASETQKNDSLEAQLQVLKTELKEALISRGNCVFMCAFTC